MGLIMAFLPDTLSEYGAIVLQVLFTAGLWGIFVKCGVKGWWALVPGLRYYKLGQCADREQYGRMVVLIQVTGVLIDGAVDLIDWRYPNLGEDARSVIYSGYLMVLIIGIIMAIVEVIYEVRIFSGLCEVFEKKKSWLFLWILADGVAAVLWGFDKNLPSSTVPERQQKAARTGLSKLHEDEQDEKKGLDINIREVAVVQNLEKKKLLQDMRLHIPGGHMVLLLGGSGAGKTTFVNAVTGYEKGTARILLDGKNIYTSFDEMKYRVGFVPQKDLMRDADTVRHTLEDAALLRLPASMGAEERAKKVDDAMKTLGITKAAETFISKLSGGQRKRVSIAMEYLASPDLFILDEPDSGLDGVIARELMQRLRGIADEGRIVIVITHTPDRIVDLFDDVIVLAKDGNRTGRLAYYGSVEGARSFFGRETMEEIVLAINQKDEGGEGMADVFIEKYIESRQSLAGGAA